MKIIRFYLKHSARFGILLFFVLCMTSTSLRAQNKISLAGQWKVKLDRADVGIQQKWYSKPLSNSKPIQLPGSIQEYDYGNNVSLETDWTASSFQDSKRLPFYHTKRYAPYRTNKNFKWPYWLTSKTYYKGIAWYQKNIEIPRDWAGKRITLNLERAHWGTMVFVDGQRAGADSSLSVPHRYDLTAYLSQGNHRISIRVDNTLLFDVGINAHSVTDHTQTNWNGLVGDLSLQAGSKQYISDVQVYPDVENKQAKVKVFLKNEETEPTSGHISVQASLGNGEKSQVIAPENKSVAVTDPSEIDLMYSMGNNPRLWDEFNPQFYTLTVSFIDGKDTLDTHKVNFGMREFKTQGTRFAINGHPVFIRGTLMCAIFPKTGYPSTSKKVWAHHFEVLKDYGLNAARFHSWCPPEEAFEAADEVGIYLQVEGPVWTAVGDGKPVDRYLYQETGRIMKAYGNHPSFVMFAHGNEPAGKHKKQYLKKFVSTWKKKDNRRVYTSGSGWPVIAENDYNEIPKPRIQQWGEGVKSVINAKSPSTDWDFRGDIKKFDKPVVGHEIGQWVVYPNFQEMSKYTGVLYPHNFEIFHDFLEKHHMADQARDFLMASGKLQAICYKADIEAALRTPGYAGYEMLGLQDFPGQGTALVGVVDPFWDPKPYITSDAFRQFSSPTVPLAVMKKRILSNDETFTADLEIAHFAKEEKQDVPVNWTISQCDGHVVARGGGTYDLPIGNNIKAGTVSLDLRAFEKPQKLNLDVKAGKSGENDWDFWVYPQKVATSPASDIITTNELTRAIERKLKQGAKVLLKLNGELNKDSGKEIKAAFSTIFWNTAWTGDQPPHTMGVLVDPSDPLFNSFPTKYYSNWQWWDIVHGVHPMILDDFPAGLTPSIQMIDTWFKARKLGLLFEGRVGKGKLIVTSIDFDNDLKNRLATRQLYHSLLDYMDSSDFNPGVSVDPALIRELYN